MSSIVVIPARGGSKRISRKNIKEFFGKPIIAYSIEAAIESCVFDEVMVSTDDEEIAETAKDNGAVVPFYRSEEMSSDSAMTAQVLIEVLGEYDKMGKAFTYICCLYPCAPFVTAERLKEGMNLLESSGADSVFPVARFSSPPQRALVIRDGGLTMLNPENYNVRSQDLEPLYHDAGQFYCIKSTSLREEEKLYCRRTLPIVLSDNEVQDIDTEDDWTAAEIKYRILRGF